MNTLFMLQMVKAGNGMSDIGTGVESNETSTGLATYFWKTWKEGFHYFIINLKSIFDVLLLQTISWSPQQSMIALQMKSRRPFQP